MPAPRHNGGVDQPADPGVATPPDTTSVLPRSTDVVVVGAGIVGLATARAVQLAAPGTDVVVLEAEDRVAAHQSSHNSGVVHAGIYYRPGSAKAELCQSGRAELLSWCDRHRVPWERRGKVVVATRSDELEPLGVLAERATANGVEVERLGPAGLAALEPHASGLAALHVPATAVIDFGAVCRQLAHDIGRRGGVIVVRCPVVRIERTGSGLSVHTRRGPISARRVANCAGLASDRVAAAAGDRPGAAIVAFRGEYTSWWPGDDTWCGGSSIRCRTLGSRSWGCT